MIWTWSHFSAIMFSIYIFFTFVRSLQRCCNALNAHQLFFTRPSIVIRFFQLLSILFLIITFIPKHTTLFSQKKAWFDVDILWPSSFLSLHISIYTYYMYAASEQGVKGKWLWFDYQFNLSWKTEIVRVCCVAYVGWNVGCGSLLLCVLVGFTPSPHIHPKNNVYGGTWRTQHLRRVFLSSHSQNHIKIQRFYYQLPPCVHNVALQHMTKNWKRKKLNEK